MKMSADLEYYNYDKILSFNAIFNFIIGGRGLGKTYGAKVKVINNFLRKGEQFIYMRRFKTEMVSKNSFFADIKHLYPNWDFRISGEEAQISHIDKRKDKKREWKTMGYFIALSTAQSRKSVSYPLVTWIIFDEFIIEKGANHYLPGESTALTNFFSTVDRYKDKTRVLFLANSVSIMNPYFLDYDIKPDEQDEFVKIKDGFIACHFANSAEFKTGVYKTRFGKFIQGTEYADYAVNSEFHDNNGNLIMLKKSNAKYVYTLESEKGLFSIWMDWTGPFYYVQESRPKQENIYTLLPEKMSESKQLMLYNNKTLQALRAAFTGGRTFFDTPKSRNSFIEIFRR